jgi:putative Holliday junction resolvase
MRIMGLDIGEKYIGIAVSDELQITAQPIKVLVRKDQKGWFKEMRTIIDNYKIGKVVIGLPFTLKKEEGQKAKEVREFAADFRKKLSLPVIFWDERLSTQEAEKILRSLRLSSKKQKKVIDKVAAAIILQGYLDYQRDNQKGGGIKRNGAFEKTL